MASHYTLTVIDTLYALGLVDAHGQDVLAARFIKDAAGAEDFLMGDGASGKLVEGTGITFNWVGSQLTITASGAGVASVTAGDGLVDTGTASDPVVDVVSHAGSAGTIGTIVVGADSIGVALGATSTVAAPGDHTHPGYVNSGLEAIQEPTNTGWRLIGRNPTHFGNIGDQAIDFSSRYADVTGLLGATGASAVAFGEDNIASGWGSFVQGNLCVANGTLAWAVGLENTATNYNNWAIGYSSNATGLFECYTFGTNNDSSSASSFTAGLSLNNDANWGSAMFGAANELYTGGGGTPLATDRILVVGNGTYSGSNPWPAIVRSNAFHILRAGELIAPSLTTTMIDAEATGRVLVTREYLTGAGYSSPLTTQGDIFYYSSSDDRLPIGANGKVLTVVAGVPSWETSPLGVTDHTLLSNIGSNTHAQIDSHIATTHYTSWALYENGVLKDNITQGNNVDFRDGDGVEVVWSTGTDLTFNNTDKGSSQNIFKNIAVSGQSTVVADNNDDVLTFVSGTGMDSITTSADTITFNAVGIANLTAAYTTTTVTIESDTGTNAVINAATNALAGLVTTGAQTWAGVKTFEDVTESTSSSTGAVVIAGGLGIGKDLNVDGGDISLTNGNNAYFNFEMYGSWSGGGGTFIMRPNNYGSHTPDAIQPVDSILYRRGLNYEPFGTIPFGVYSYNVGGNGNARGNKLLHAGWFTGRPIGSSMSVDIDQDVLLAPDIAMVDIDRGGDKALITKEYLDAAITAIAEVNDLSASVTWANVPNANITEASVTQHEAALSISTSQISDETELVMNDTDTYSSHPDAQKIITLTSAEYGAIGTPDANTLYFVI